MARSPASPTTPPLRRNAFKHFAGWMKIGLLVIATLLVALIFLWPRFEDEQTALLTLTEESERVDEGEGSRAGGLQFRGIDKKNQKFSVTALSAVQEKRDGEEINLESPAAEIVLDDRTRVAVQAENGYYNRKSEKLRLVGAVTLNHGKDFQLTTEEALVDLKAGTAESDRPVEARSSEGRLTAEGLRIVDHGQKIFFTGRSRLILHGEEK